MKLTARDDDTDDSISEYSEIHQVGGIAILPDDAGAKTQPEEDECCRERNAEDKSVRGAIYTCSYPRRSKVVAGSSFNKKAEGATNSL